MDRPAHRFAGWERRIEPVDSGLSNPSGSSWQTGGRRVRASRRGRCRPV